MIRRLTLGLMLVSAVVATPAQANKTLFGVGPGQSCFQAVRFGASGTAELKLCTDALESGLLSRKDISATLVNRGIVLMRMQRFTQAIADYEQALEMRPDLAEAKINMGAALIGLRRFSSAIDYLEEGISGESASTHVAYYNLGIAHEMIGDYQTAREAYSKALEIAPEWGLAKKKLDTYGELEPAASAGENANG